MNINPHVRASRDSISGNSNATEPKVSPRSARTPNRPGRKIVGKPMSAHLLSRKDPSKTKEKSTEHATIEELDQMLEDDALVLLNMKKDITNSQKEELLKLKASVMAIKKEHDTIHVANNLKEVQLKALKDKQIALSNVENATLSTSASVDELKRTLEDQASKVLEEHEAEQRTIKMQTLMTKRLEKEIAQCRVDTSKAVIMMDQAKHDVSITETALQLSRQEVIDLEMQLDKLNTTLKSRKDQREKKLHMLTTLSHQGESSVAKLQNSISEQTRRLELTTRQRARQAQAASRHQTARLNKDEEDEFADFIDPNNTNKKLSIIQIRDMVQRYMSQSARMERLRQLDTELRSTIILQQKKKNELTEHLSHTVFRIQQLASSRQIYQEVDLKDSALSIASKECEEYKDKEFRLKLSIESLKQSIPRFLMKVTKVSHPKPTENQLSDAILKLEDELTKLIKTIGSSLLKDATPEDLAMISQLSAASSGNDSISEFARLQRLPGYSRLQRQLFYNLMTARPDNSTQNIRIDHVGKIKQPRSTYGPSSHYEDPVPINIRHINSKHIDDDNDINEEDNESEPAFGRVTIKSISKLICERDYSKPSVAPNTSSDFTTF